MPLCAHLLPLSLTVDRMWKDTKPGAVKRGRNPRYPYVPVKIEPDGSKLGEVRSVQYRNRAFATREEAVGYARQVMRASAMVDVGRLVRPEARLYRVWNGLPRELDNESIKQ